MISIDYSLIVVILNFILMLIVLNKLLYKPMQQFLSDRQKNVEKEITEAKEKNLAADKILRKNEEDQKKSSEEIRNLTRKAKKEAENQAEDIIAQARDREKQILMDSEVQLAHQREVAQKKLEKDVALFVSSLTEKLLDKKLDSAQDKELIDAVIKEGE